MSDTKRRGNSQGELFPMSKYPIINIEADHPLVTLTEELNWTGLMDAAQTIRTRKLKNAAGRPPRLRALIGAMVLRATRYMPYRVLEDHIQHYAPARYLCGLTETDWSPDYRTLCDFNVLMGEEGARMINEQVVVQAVKEKLADPTLMVADMTAQEAAIPYPNEIGLMATFIATVKGAASKAGKVFKEFAHEAASQFNAAKEKAREYQLFAKGKEEKNELMAQMLEIVKEVHAGLGKAVEKAKEKRVRVTKSGKVARQKLLALHETMEKLLPQIQHWLDTGWVATGKIISLHIPELYSIVRGKVGKKVEFGLSWGIRRLGGGYLLGTVATSRKDLVDARFAVSAVDEHIALFGKPPVSYAYDRGGWSNDNVATLKEKGVKDVGLAPRGKADWQVSGRTKKKLIAQRAQVEAGIGTIKHSKYRFNRPAARSTEMMAAYGQQAVLGFNLNKLVRELAEPKRLKFAA